MEALFGDYIKALRLERRLSLRAFAHALGSDPANYSKVERGLLQAPTGPARLEPYRRALGLETSSPEWREAVRLASLSRGELPRSALSDGDLVAKLPALFRTLDGDPVDESRLDELIALIRREH